MRVSIGFVTTDATCKTFLDSNAQLPNITPFTQSGNSNRQCITRCNIIMSETRINRKQSHTRNEYGTEAEIDSRWKKQLLTARHL